MSAASGRLRRDPRASCPQPSRDARAAWSWTTTLWVLAFAGARSSRRRCFRSRGGCPTWPSFVYLALAAVGLAYAVGLAGIPSLGQGAFLGIGAFTEALLRTKAGWPLLPSLVAAIAITAGCRACSPGSRPAGCGARSSRSAPGS